MKGRVDGLEARVDGIEAGSFTDTTTMKGKAKFLIGGADGPDGTDEAVTMNYFWEIDLNTSFTGEDKLNVEIETGNTPDGDDLNGGLLAITDFGKDKGDVLEVSDLNYTFPLGDWTITVGDSLDASKQFTGACEFDNVVDSLSDCGTGNSVAVGGDQTISAGYDLDNGFSFGLGVSAEDGENEDGGIFTEEGEDIVALNLGYSNDAFGTDGSYEDDATYAYEVSYEYPINDGMKVMPFVAIVEGEDDAEDTTVAGLQVGFKF